MADLEDDFLLFFSEYLLLNIVSFALMWNTRL